MEAESDLLGDRVTQLVGPSFAESFKTDFRLLPLTWIEKLQPNKLSSRAHLSKSLAKFITLLAQHSGDTFADTQKKGSFRDATEVVKVKEDREGNTQRQCHEKSGIRIQWNLFIWWGVGGGERGGNPGNG